jgi:hypothetical protein
MGSIPVLVDDAAGLTVPESTTIIEYVDGLGDAPRLVPADPAAALQARLWDRVVDGHVMTPMQKIVGDSLRPEGGSDPEGVDQARATLDRAYALLDDALLLQAHEPPVARPGHRRRPRVPTRLSAALAGLRGVGRSLGRRVTVAARGGP